MSYLKKKNIQVYMDFCKGSLKITKQIKSVCIIKRLLIIFLVTLNYLLYIIKILVVSKKRIYLFLEI